MIRRLLQRIRRAAGVEALEARLARTEAIVAELLENVRQLGTEVRDGASGAQATLETLGRDIEDHARAIQLDQLDLGRPGTVTFRVAGSTQPVLRLWRASDGTLAFVADAGAKPFKVAVVTLPKAGTYLMAEVLVELGYVNTHLHAWAGGVEDGRDRPAEQAPADYLAHRVALPVEVSAPLIRPGQFWVGHFEAVPCRGPLAGFRKILMIRDLRFGLVSFMRWMAKPGRGGAAADAWRHLPETTEKLLAFFETHGRGYLTWCADIVGWCETPDVCVLRFEDVAGLHGEPAQADAATALATFLVEVPEAVGAALRRSVGRTTKTYSGRLSSLEGLWSPRVEQVFEEAGGVELNRVLGYAPTCVADRVRA